MKNYKYIFLLSIVVLIAGCTKIDDPSPSKPVTSSVPYVVDQYANDIYAFGVGSNKIYSTIPDTIGLVADSVLGFTGGFGGHTGHDFAYLLKSDIVRWPDTTKEGGASLAFEKYNSSGFKAKIVVNVVIAEPISGAQKPGPTALEGTYKRTTNGFLITIVKIFDGVYLIDNLGGAGTVPAYPFLLKNFKSTSGKDSLSFKIQANSCGGGAQLIDPTSGPGLTAAEYSASHPPIISSLSPVTLKWIVMEFNGATSESIGTPGLCAWGGSVRTFEKQ